MKFYKFVAVVFSFVSGFVLTGCGENGTSVGGSSAAGLNIVGGSELKVLEPIFKDVQKATGVSINVKYTGTIEGVEEVRSGGFDAAWFGNAKYFFDDAQVAKKIKLSEKMMLSPVIVGVKPASMAKYQIKESGKYNWADISKWVSEKGMRYAMTDPSVSNSGYVALMGIVYSTANKGESVKESDVNEKAMKKFFEGQKLTAKSSNWIMEKFNTDPEIDFVVNYESAILENNPKLIPVYPNEGIVTSDYPLMLLNEQKMESYKKVVAYFKSVEVQKRLVEEYKYRSINADVMSKQKVFDMATLLIEMPFNPDANLSDTILSAYFDKYKKPAKFAFVLDISGSMGGSREKMMKDAIDRLVSGNLSKYATIRERESVFIVPFASQVYPIKEFNKSSQKEMNEFVKSLNMGGGTAMYNAVSEAMLKLYEDKKINGDKFRYSVIVLTDGMSNEGASMVEFKDWFYRNKMDKEDMRVFAIAFGDSDIGQLKSITGITGGNVFDGKKSLSSAFREIRAYQ